MGSARLVLGSLPLLLLASACDRGLTGGTDDDFSPPGMIDDLRIRLDDATATGFTLDWTAVGADLTSDDVPVSRYEIYWGEETITVLNYEDMNLVENNLTPKAAGEAESFRVDGLPQGPELYFAVATYDGSGNQSFSIDIGQRAVAATPGSACLPGGDASVVTAWSEAALIRFQGCEAFAGNLTLTDVSGLPGGISSLGPLASLRTVHDGVWADWEEISDANASLIAFGLPDLTSLGELSQLEEVELLLVGGVDYDDGLTEFGLPALRKVGNALFEGLPAMTTARLPALVESVNLVDFEEMEAATAIELPAADRIELLNIENNPLLTRVSLPSVSHIESLDLVDNPELETLELPQTFTAFSISISGCPKLDPCVMKTRFEGLLTEDGLDVVYLDIDGADSCN